jgi:hypothetical protein
LEKDPRFAKDPDAGRNLRREREDQKAAHSEAEVLQGDPEEGGAGQVQSEEGAQRPYRGPVVFDVDSN